MNSPRFASWTRRRIGLAVAGFMASLGGLTNADPAGARKKKKKRCTRLGKACIPEGRRCCHGRTCGGPPEARFCCEQGGEACSGNGDCCNLQCIDGLCALN